jgi:pimeloyl-ACP methyl ester carboxylesterase
MKRTFLFREGQVAYQQKGKGRAVFLLHGFMESSAIWNYYITTLSQYFRVITIDLPGHGDTDCYGYVHSMEMMADCVHALMRHLNLRKIFLVGHSMGGYVSLAFAEHYPDHVKGICLFHSTSRSDDEPKKKNRDKAIKVIKRNPSVFINESVPNLFFRKYKSYGHAIARMKRMAHKNPVQGILANLEGMKSRTDRSILIRFAPYPILFIAGKEDNVLPYEDQLRLSELSYHSRVFLLEDVGHMGFIEAREQCWIALKSFIQRPEKFVSNVQDHLAAADRSK